MILGIIIAIITFPGVIVHELAHQLFCIATGTRVHEVCYFQLKNPVGYVLHDPPDTPWKQIIIGIGPFLVNSVAGFLIGLIAHMKVFDGGAWDRGGFWISWLAISIAMHAFPSIVDAGSILGTVWQKGTPLLARLVGSLLAPVIWLGALGSVVWLDALYAAYVAWELPILAHKLIW